MGLFNNLFGGKEVAEKASNINWTPLTELSQLDEMVEVSKEKAVAVFKHSTRCGISRMVLKDFESAFNLPDGNYKIYFLDVLNHRNISNEIASRFEVWHESPQLLVFKDGNVVYHASHGSIEAARIRGFI